MGYNETPTKEGTTMAVLTIKFTRETLPLIIRKFPRMDGYWSEADIDAYTAEDHYFVFDTYAAGAKMRVITKEHLADVYECMTSEIGETFKRLY